MATNYNYSESPLTGYHTYDISNLQRITPTIDNGTNTPNNIVINYGTPGQVETSTYEIYPNNFELRKKLEENLPDECFIRDEDGNLKKVTKVEAIEFELKEANIVISQGNGLESQINQYKQITKGQLEEWYKHTMLQGHTHNSDTSRDYVLHTGIAGRDMFHQAMETAAANWTGLSTSNHL